MNIYHYEPATGKFLGQGVADESPLEPGIFLAPACSTSVAPPPIAAGMVAVFRNGEWCVVAEPAPVQVDLNLPLTQAEKIASLERALDRHLDAVAQGHRFGDRTRLALRAAYPNQWQSLGTAFGSWMDDCNALVAAGLAEVVAGERPLPTEEEMLAGLPAFEFTSE